MTSGCGGKQYCRSRHQCVHRYDMKNRADLGIEVRRVQVDMVELLAFDRRMQNVLGAGAEVATVQVAEHA